jgi:uncharacterized protein YidB (DUF937 family)
MGLFDQLASAAEQALGKAATDALAPMVTKYLGEAEGGLTGLTDKLKDAGLGDQVSSWLGMGQNLPISEDQIKAALGNEQVQAIANSLGLDLNQVAGALSQFLPKIIDKASPNGVIEEPSA